MHCLIMNPALVPIIEQWPSLAGLVALALFFWKMVEKYTEESKAILEANKSLSNQRAEEINRLRAMLDQIEQQKVGSYESYQT